MTDVPSIHGRDHETLVQESLLSSPVSSYDLESNRHSADDGSLSVDHRTHGRDGLLKEKKHKKKKEKKKRKTTKREDISSDGAVRDGDVAAGGGGSAMSKADAATNQSASTTNHPSSGRNNIQHHQTSHDEATSTSHSSSSGGTRSTRSSTNASPNLAMTRLLPSSNPNAVHTPGQLLSEESLHALSMVSENEFRRSLSGSDHQGRSMNDSNGSSAADEKDGSTVSSLTFGTADMLDEDTMVSYLVSIGLQKDAARQVARKYLGVNADNKAGIVAATEDRPSERAPLPPPPPAPYQTQQPGPEAPRRAQRQLGRKLLAKTARDSMRRLETLEEGIEDNRSFADDRSRASSVASSKRRHNSVPNSPATRSPGLGINAAYIAGTQPFSEEAHSYSTAGEEPGLKLIQMDSVAKRKRRRLMAAVFLMIILTAVVAIVLGTREGSSGSNRVPEDDTEVSSLATPTVSPTPAPSFTPTRISHEISLAATLISGVDLVTTESSPQRQAVGWLSSEKEPSIELDSEDFRQRYVLVVLFYSTAGYDWPRRFSWLSHDLHVCDWSVQILCRDRTVFGLALKDNNLDGTLPFELKFLPLEKLNVAENRLVGSIPTDLCSTGSYESLFTLEMQFNQLTGSIPDLSGCNERIVTVDLSHNQLMGTLPTSLAAATSLYELILSDNELTGTLEPLDLKNLPDLSRLDLSRNRLEGRIPDINVGLSYLHLDHNLLTGGIPVSTLSSRFLQLLEITVSDNLLDDSFFSGLNFASHFGEASLFSAASPELQKIDFSNNAMTGELPVSPEQSPLALVPSMLHFDGSNNNLTGALDFGRIFPSIQYISFASNSFTSIQHTKFSELRHWDVSDNRLSSGLVEFHPHRQLEYIDFSGNPDLNLNLDPQIRNLKQLRELRLHDTGLSGTIPDELTLLTNLEILDVRSTKLQGPLRFDNLVGLEELAISNTSLAGTISLDLCQRVEISAADMKSCDLRCPCCEYSANCFARR